MKNNEGENRYDRGRFHCVVLPGLADQKTARTAADFHRASNPPLPPPRPVLPGETPETDPGPSEPEQPDEPSTGRPGTEPELPPEELKRNAVWFLWTMVPGSTPRYHVEDHRSEYRTACKGVDLDPEKYFRTRHKPLGLIMCQFCRKNRGKFDDQHEPFKQPTIPCV
jgi:hypothetical protein